MAFTFSGAHGVPDKLAMLYLAFAQPGTPDGFRVLFLASFVLAFFVSF
jgi:hypothetical protein